MQYDIKGQEQGIDKFLSCLENTNIGGEIYFDGDKRKFFLKPDNSAGKFLNLK